MHIPYPICFAVVIVDISGLDVIGIKLQIVKNLFEIIAFILILNRNGKFERRDILCKNCF